MNLIFIFADQMRAGCCGFDGHPLAVTPNLDQLAASGLRFSNCISGIPVCTPWRACFLTGQYPLTHGVFMNDLRLPTDRPTLGTILRQVGYRTGYIGKWHLDGPDRGAFTPPGPRRQGFDFWATANCSHDYLHSHYYRDTPELLYWQGYDAAAQTDLAIEFLAETHQSSKPFALVMSWGPPHDPYDAVPPEYFEKVPPDRVLVPPNCPNPRMDELRGYHAHVRALDDQIGRLNAALEQHGLTDDTIFVFTSDHGDMLGSHSHHRKQLPWEESLHVPFLLRAPMQFAAGREVKTLLNVWDILPTMLDLLHVPCPCTVEGVSCMAAVYGETFTEPPSTFAGIIAPFAEYRGQPWRVVRTARHTYARNLDGPWLLYDNETDPFQRNNLVNLPEHSALQAAMEQELRTHLHRAHDDFQSPQVHLNRWGYKVGPDGAIPCFNSLWK